MNYFDWIDWLDRWFTPDAAFFWAGVFVGFLFFCCVLFIDDEIQRRKDENALCEPKRNDLFLL